MSANAESEAEGGYLGDEKACMEGLCIRMKVWGGRERQPMGGTNKLIGGTVATTVKLRELSDRSLMLTLLGCYNACTPNALRTSAIIVSYTSLVLDRICLCFAFLAYSAYNGIGLLWAIHLKFVFVCCSCCCML